VKETNIIISIKNTEKACYNVKKESIDR